VVSSAAYRDQIRSTSLKAVTGDRNQTVIRASTVSPSRFSDSSSLLTMAHLTPGLRYLASGAAYGSVPVIGVFALQHLLKWAFGAHIPTWMAIVTSLATFPVGAIIRLSLKEWKDRRSAGTMGAQIVPKVAGKWLGNVDVLQMVQEASVSGYPSMCSLMRFLSDKLADEFMCR
jgi:hypothetical protein